MTQFTGAIFILLLVAFNAGAETVGKVVFVKGDVSVTRQVDNDGSLTPLKRRDVLLLGDKIETGGDGKFSAKLNDGSVITLGHNSDFSIETYVYQESSMDEATAVFETTKGAFRAVTGAIQKATKRDYVIKTPLAVIGVRGTDFWGGFIFGDQLDVTVLSGKGVYVETASGKKVLLNKDEGTTVKSLGADPTAPKIWPREKLLKAIASVALD